MPSTFARVLSCQKVKFCYVLKMSGFIGFSNLEFHGGNNVFVVIVKCECFA